MHLPRTIQLLLGGSAVLTAAWVLADEDEVEWAAGADVVATAEVPDTLAILPQDPGAFAPSFMSAASGEEIDPAVLADIETCAQCHAEIARQWQSSAHGLASFNNPFYRASIDRLRDNVGFFESRHCGGCHDIALMPNGGMDVAVAPEDPLGHVGVSCNVCHGIESVTADGNGSYVLTTSPVPLPEPNDAESLARHIDRVSMPVLRTAELCVSCHRGFLGEHTGNAHHLIGMDDASDWQRSAYAGQSLERVEWELGELSCAGCHMPQVEGLASHRFPGAHTALAAAMGDAEQLEAEVALLRTAVTMDLALVGPDGALLLPADGAGVVCDTTVGIDVIIRNTGAGHRFPGGTLDAQDTWIELEVRDRLGRLVAASGLDHEDDPADTEAHTLRALVVDDEGVPVTVHDIWRFRAQAWNSTILPRDVHVVGYSLEVPPAEQIEMPLRVSARLRHRRHLLDFQQMVCESVQSERGQAFDAASLALNGFVVDGCAPMPVIDVAEAEVWVGEGAEGFTAHPQVATPLWQRAYEYGLGLLHARQEELDGARPALELALAEAMGESDEVRAAILVALAELEGREGRTEVALDLLAQAEALAPEHAAIDYRRGMVLAQVWRWDEAAAAFAELAASSPTVDVAWRQLALAQVSAGQDEAGLWSAQTGLALQPRDATLLLDQAVALAALAAPEETLFDARAAYLRYRPYDGAPRVRFRCFNNVERCADERTPLHRHTLLPQLPAIEE